jgi:hypothetical protein
METYKPQITDFPTETIKIVLSIFMVYIQTRPPWYNPGVSGNMSSISFFPPCASPAWNAGYLSEMPITNNQQTEEIYMIPRF